jgi:SPP1 family phage portal protein
MPSTSSFGWLNNTSPGFATQTTQPSEQTAALLFMRKLQESERHRVLLNYFAFYEGTHYSYIRDLAEPTITVNYAAAFVNKSTIFLFGNGFAFQSETGEEVSPEIDTLNEIWEDNDKDDLTYKIGINGAVAGDAFVKITYVPETDKIVLTLLDTQTCFPIYNPFNPDVFDGFKIEYIVYTGAAGDYNDIHLYTEVYQNNRIQIAWDGEVKKEFDNPFGFIPIVQFKNIYNPRSPYGVSDLRDLINLNRSYNEQNTKFQDIVNYHAEPVTLVFGAKMNNLVKGARKVWSGLPINAKVENLQMQSDLPALQTFIDNTKQQMHEIGFIPMNALGQEQAISNTSNAALQTMYLPLIDKTNAKRITYGKSIRLLNKYILRVNNLIRGTKLDENIRHAITWESPLPKDDERLVTQYIMPLKQLNLISDTEALKLLGYKDPQAMIEQIRKERVENADIDGQCAVAQNPPQLAENMAPPMEPENGANKAQQNPKPKSDSQKENQELPGG